MLQYEAREMRSGKLARGLARKVKTETKNTTLIGVHFIGLVYNVYYSLFLKFLFL